MKKNCLFLLFIFLLTSFCPVFAQGNFILIDKIGTYLDGDPDADKIRIWENYKYIVLEDGTAAIKGYEGDEKEVVIPDLIDGTYEVTEIRSFRHNDPDDEFREYQQNDNGAVNTNTLSITLPDSLRTIEGNPFIFCKYLQQFTVSESHPVFEVINGVLFDRESHKLVSYPVGKEGSSYEIPSGTFSVGGYAFFEASGLNSVVLPDGMETVGAFSFAQCGDLASVNFPEGLRTIEDGAFFNCISLTELKFPDTLSEIGEAAFMGNTGITSLALPEGIKTIERQTFSDCYKLESVSIPDSVTVISSGAFENCIHLNSVFISKNVELIGDGAFLHCMRLTDFSVSEENPVYVFMDGALYDKNKSALVMYLITSPDETYTIADDTLSIGSYAFSGAVNLTSVNIPETVTEIGKYAFQNCLGLTNIDLPESVSRIGSGIFMNCRELVSVNLPKGIENIPYESFRGCKSLPSLVIPDGVTTIAGAAFIDADNLKSLTIPASVTDISNFAFFKFNREGVTITTERGSAAEQFAMALKLDIIYMDENE